MIRMSPGNSIFPAVLTLLLASTAIGLAIAQDENRAPEAPGSMHALPGPGGNRDVSADGTPSAPAPEEVDAPDAPSSASPGPANGDAVAEPTDAGPATSAEGEAGSSDSEMYRAAEGEQAPVQTPEAEEPSERVKAPVTRSRRQAEVIGALESLSRPEADGGRARPGQAALSSDALTHKVVLWRSELRMTAALAARRLRELEKENKRLEKLGVHLPWAIRRGRVRPAQGREERERLIAGQERFDALYDELTQAAQDVGAEIDAYSRALERARALRLDRTLVSTLESGIPLATQAKADFQAAAQMAVANARLVSDIVPRLDAALEVAETRGLLRRSEVRITAQTPVTAADDFRRLIRSIGAYLRTGVWPGAEFEPDDGTPPSWPITELAGLGLAGVLLAVGFRRLRRRLTDEMGSRLEMLPQEQRDLTLWRYARGFEIVRAALAFALLAAGVQSLPLSPSGSLSLTGLVFAWCAYAAARPLVRIVLAPGEEGFGLLRCDAATSRRTATAAHAIAVYSALLLPVIHTLALYDYPHADVELALKLLYGLGAVIFLIWLTNSARGSLALIGNASGQAACGLPEWATRLNAFVSLAAVALLVMTAMGYANLSSYLARSLVLSALFVAVAWPAYGRLNRELMTRFPVTPHGPAGLVHRPWMQQVIRLAFVLLSALLLARIWGVRRYHLYDLIALVSQPLIDVKGAQISILAIAKAILVWVVASWAAGYARRCVQESAALSQRWDHGTRHAVGSVLYYCLLAGGIVLAILVAGMQLSILAAFAGMFGIAIGFGSQDIAKNTICGLIIMLDRSINAGDYVDVAGQSGTIADITVRSTTIRTQDNRLVVIPNSVFYTQNVVVSSQRDRRVRLVVDVAVAPDTDFDTVAEVLREAAISQDSVLDTPEPEVLFSKLAANGLNLQLVAWTDHIDSLPTVQGRLMHSIWRALKEHDIALV